MLFPHFHKPRIAIVLNGGGARGPYQIGVYLAMEKYGLTDYIAGTAGSSIGSFSSILYLLKDPVDMMSFWCHIDNRLIKQGKRNKAAALFGALIKKDGYYSREALGNFLRENFDLKKMAAEANYPLYVSLAEEVKDKKGKVVSYTPRYVKLNGMESEDIITVLLATSAIPMVFDPVEFQGRKYVDPMKADNDPYKPLLNLNADMLFLIPLNNSHLEKTYPDDLPFPVVDFASPTMMALPKMNMIDFNPSDAEFYVSEGYQTGGFLLRYLYERKLLHALDRRQKKESPKPFYSLRSLGISNIEFDKMDLQDILSDVEKGAE
jgi:NTE family protein